MAEVVRPNRETCPHLVMDLRPCFSFPNDWIECGTCGETFKLERVISYELDNSTARLLAVARALPGLSTDKRPLANMLAPGVTVAYARVVQTNRVYEPQVDEATDEPDLKWRS